MSLEATYMQRKSLSLLDQELGPNPSRAQLLF